MNGAALGEGPILGLAELGGEIGGAGHRDGRLAASAAGLAWECFGERTGLCDGSRVHRCHRPARGAQTRRLGDRLQRRTQVDLRRDRVEQNSVVIGEELGVVDPDQRVVRTVVEVRLGDLEWQQLVRDVIECGGGQLDGGRARLPGVTIDRLSKLVEELVPCGRRRRHRTDRQLDTGALGAATTEVEVDLAALQRIDRMERHGELCIGRIGEIGEHEDRHVGVEAERGAAHEQFDLTDLQIATETIDGDAIERVGRRGAEAQPVQGVFAQRLVGGRRLGGRLPGDCVIGGRTR